MLYNEIVYALPNVVHSYRKAVALGLTTAEKYCFGLVPKAHQKSVLDIGIGAGRTTGPLCKIFGQYTGIDNSPKLIRTAQNIFHDVELLYMDARDLAFYKRFDCICFSSNGIDTVLYNDRRLIMQQIMAVLKPDGYFIYSTHNVHHRRARYWMNQFWIEELFQSPTRIDRMSRRICNRIMNYRRQFSDVANGITYVNDPGDEFSLLNAYVDISRELGSLSTYGLRVVSAIGERKENAGYDDRDCWVYIVAQRR